RLVQLAELRMNAGHERPAPALPTLIAQPGSNAFRLAQALEYPPRLAELGEDGSQLQTDLEGLLEEHRASGQGLQDRERLLEIIPPLGRRCPPRRGVTRLAEIDRGLLPELAAKGVMGQPLRVLLEPIVMQGLDRSHDPRVKLSTA